MPNKRENYLEWQEYFMSIAFLSAQRSKDPRTQVGACIVNSQNKIVGIGYNGMPVGCHDDKMPWNRAIDKSTENWLNSKTPYVCHAELNAVLNKNLADLTGCVIYVALFPCNMCAQIIVQSGIKEVFFYSDKYHDQPHMIASRRLLAMAGVKYSQFKPRQKKVVIDFDLIETTPGLDPTLNDSVISSNGELAMNNKAEAVNNNNKGAEKTSSFINHAEMQNLPPNLQQQVQGTFQDSSGEESPTSLGLEHFKFSVLSMVFIIGVVFLSWLISQLSFEK